MPNKPDKSDKPDKSPLSIDPIIKHASTSFQRVRAMAENSDAYHPIENDVLPKAQRRNTVTELNPDSSKDHTISIPSEQDTHTRGGHMLSRRLSTSSAHRDSTGIGISRFKKATNQIIQAQRASKISPYALRGQGVNPKDMDSIFGCIENDVEAMAMDMNQDQYISKKSMGNAEFLEWLDEPRPEWSKVRWININGMSWDIIKAISIKYNIHHLAVEDLLHVPQRTKVDIYPENVYIACTLLTLMEELEDGEFRQVDPSSSEHRIDPEILSQRFPLDKMDHFRYQYPISDVEGGLRVQMEQVTMLLINGGTLITIFQVSGSSVITPIAERLTHGYSIVRKNNDSTFLLQSIIDGIVDHAIPIIDSFRQEINELEAHVLALPRMRYTRELHHMTAQLTMLKRTLAPTQALVHSLRGRDERSPLTSLSKTYMGDVMDHCNTMVEDIDSMLSLCEKLINMIFNIIAYDTNESMRRLALVSIIFLPITFIAGVYGTNFVDFPELSHNISYFWIICAVVTAIVLAAFAIEWLKNQYKAAQVEKCFKRRNPISIGGSKK
ncbi:hypothetical protein BGZ76_006282 [Entomortierella beljakovae]|nr:hypothetical protein BGZ76_006282 [Entomortierella beljakovae]